jgi:hypothetical protein
MRSRILVPAGTAAVLCLVGGCAVLPAPRGPNPLGTRQRAARQSAWTDFLACTVLSDSASRHDHVRDACDVSDIDARKPTNPLPRPENNTP